MKSREIFRNCKGPVAIDLISNRLQLLMKHAQLERSVSF